MAGQQEWLSHGSASISLLPKITELGEKCALIPQWRCHIQDDEKKPGIPGFFVNDQLMLISEIIDHT
jgi:hypothetical protein